MKYHCILIATLYSFCCLLLLSPAPSEAGEYCSSSMAAGTPCGCKLAELHPTQMAIGKLRVLALEGEGFDHLARHVAKAGKHALVVVGPTGTLYIVDGHHHARAMEDLDKTGETSCQIDKLVQNLPTDPVSFWARMEGLGLARLDGADGVRRPGVFPPADLRDLADDPFRTVSGWIESKCSFKLAGDFADFRLADLLRSDPKAVAPSSDADEASSVAEGLRFLKSPLTRPRLTNIAGPDDVKALAECE